MHKHTQKRVIVKRGSNTSRSSPLTHTPCSYTFIPRNDRNAMSKFYAVSNPNTETIAGSSASRTYPHEDPKKAPQSPRSPLRWYTLNSIPKALSSKLFSCVRT